MFDNLVRTTSLFVSRNSNTILTGFGVAGVVTTAVLASKATVQAMNAIFHEEMIGGTAGDPKQRAKERIKVAWQFYIPAVSVGAVTIGCIIGAHTISTRKTAALASAYTLVNRAFTDHKAQVLETFGERKAQEIRDKIADKQVAEHPTSLVIVGEGNVLCWDSLSDRYFESTPERIRRAENELNAKMLHGESTGVSLNDLYSRVGLNQTVMGEELGWSDDTLLKINISSHMTDDERPCLALSFDNPPFPAYWKINR